MNFFRKQEKDNEEFSLKLDSLTTELTDTNTELTELKEAFSTLSTLCEDLQAQVTTLTSEKAELEKDKEVAEELLEESTEDNAELVKEVVTVDQAAADKAVELIAEVGHEPVEVLPDELEEAEEANKVPLIDQLKSLSGEELSTFYKENKEEIFKLLKQ